MKVTDSGMPDETYWNSLFDIPLIVNWLDIMPTHKRVVEIGCGYGTFTVPVSQKTAGKVYAFDIDSDMIERANTNAREAGSQNIKFFLRDVLEKGTGLESDSAAMVLLFNILHFDERRKMLEEASRILKSSGVVAIIHWRKDIETPRGPSLETRPDEQTILRSIGGLDLSFNGNSRILEPYHWGIQLIKGISE